MFSAPAVAGERVFVGSCSGSYYALDARTGAVVWSYDTARDGAAGQFHGDALVTDELVIVGSDARPAGHLYALDRKTGAARWKLPFAGGVAADVLQHGDAAVAVAVSGEVFAVEPASGTLLWHVDAAPEAARGARTLDAALAAGRLVVPWRPGVVDALDAGTGQRLWRRDLGVGLNTGAAVAGNDAWVGALDGRIYRLNAATGEIVASLDTGGTPYGNLVHASDSVLALWAEGDVGGAGSFAGPHVVACLELTLNRVRWRFESPAEWGTFSPLVRDREVVVGSQGLLLALGLADGRALWQRGVRGLPRGLAATGDTLYVGTLEGPVLALPWEPAGAATPSADGDTTEGYRSSSTPR